MPGGVIGVVVGLRAEARVAAGWGVPVAVGGGTAAGAAGVAGSLVGRVSGLVSFGLAGGLAPGLRAGDIVVPRLVVDGDEAWAADAGLMARLGGGTGHVLLGGGAVLASVAAKRAAHAGGGHAGGGHVGGADAVDLESAAVARVAAAAGLPFAVLRAVCDEAGRALPLAALVALDARGRIGVLRVAAAVVRRPWEIGALVGLGRDAARARAALAGRVGATSLIGG